MITKRILIIMLFFAIHSSVYSGDSNFSLILNNWEVDSNYNYNYNVINAIGVKPYIKNIKEIEFTVPKAGKSETYFLYFYNHRGFSKVYIDDDLILTIGLPNHIHQNSQIYSKGFRIPVFEENVSLKIINYAYENSIKTTYKVTNSDKAFENIILRKIVKESMPIVYFFICILILITSCIYNTPNETQSSRRFIISLILFIFYFLIRFLDEQIFLNLDLIYIRILLSFFAWHKLVSYYARKHNLWNDKKIFLTFMIMLTLLVLFTVAYLFNSPNINIEITKQIALLIVYVGFLKLLVKSNIKNEKVLIIGLLIASFLQLIGFIYLSITNQPIYGVIQTGFLIIIISSYLSIFYYYKNFISSTNNYNEKLLDSIEKLKQELEKKELEISDLKTINEDSEREKSLFFSTLSSNLRTPLNSIIGYSENLYSTDKIEEVHHIVNELIVESDKIFQSINNIMDFSTRNFSDLDLQLKNFRMKEIFENSVYGSTIITGFRKHIKYIAEKDSDKILINGNPLIYKQITTSVFHFLIGLNPKNIDFTITNSGVEKEYLNLVVKYKGTGLDYSDFAVEESIKSNRDLFSKYIKLYAIEYREEITDSSYEIEFNFQCGLAGEVDKVTTKEQAIINTPLNKSLSVLVVEDYKPNLNIVKMHLTKMGCDVYTAENGDEAITIFNREMIDVILMDIKMPVMDGWEATESIRSTKRGLDTLIVGLTASSLDLDIRHCFESGMDDVLVKPIRKNQLYKKLNTFESFKPEQFPNIRSLRADYRLSKVETETLFKASITQILKQLEVIEMLASAEDDIGIEREKPAIIHASSTINAFYYSRLLRNYFDAYSKREKTRLNQLMLQLKSTINEVISEHEDIFRD